jgi:hypothetical protein
VIVDVDEGPDDFDDEVNAYVAEFQANIDASPDFVYVVLSLDDMTLVGVASKVARADEIADSVGGGCLIIAAKIDDPQWGNRPKE